MNLVVVSVSAIVLYLIAAAGIARALFRAAPVPHGALTLDLGLGAAAVVLHGLLLYQHLLIGGRVDFGVFNTASLVACLIATVVLIASLFRPVVALAMVIFPIAALAVGLELAFTGGHVVTAQMTRGIDVHVALSLLAYSILAIAALQAVVLAVADYQLRRKRPLKVMRALPPLASMEALLFQLIGVGLFLLSLGLISGFLFVEDLLAQHLVHKTVLSLLAWLTFAILLWGRRYRGWRGRTAVRYTVSGFVLLMLGFFGSQVVLQLILHRV